MITRYYECEHCGYYTEHDPDPGEPYAEICPACLAPFSTTGGSEAVLVFLLRSYHYCGQ